MSFKKWFNLVVVIVTILGLGLAACAPAATVAPTKAPEPTKAPVQPTKAVEPTKAAVEPTKVAPTTPPARTKVKVISWWDFTTSIPLQELKKGFEAKNPDLELEFVNLPSKDYYDKVLTMIAGGADLPDVMMLAMDKVPVFASRGAIQKLDSYVNDAFKKDLFPVALQAVSYQGSMYAMPRDITPKVMFLNKAMFEAAGIPIPSANWTVDEFRAIAKKLTKVDAAGVPTQWGFYFPKYADGIYHWVRLFDGAFVDETGTKSLLNTPASVSALKFLQDMVLVDKSVPTESQAKQFGTSDQAPFVAGKAAMVAGGLSYTTTFDKEKVAYVTLPLPVGKKTLTTAFVNSWTMPKGAKDAKLSWRVMEFLSGKEGQQIVLNTNMGLPASKSVDTAAFVAKRTDNKTFLDSLAVAEPFPAPIYGADYYTMLVTQTELMWLGQIKVEEAVEKVVKDGNKILSGQN